MAKKKSTPLPFSFVMEYLYPNEPVVKPMFGCFALYLGRKIVLILRKRSDHKNINGVWIATNVKHHESLRKLFPSMKSIEVLGKNPTNWQVLPESSDDFEESVIKACELIVKGDPRIGTIPKEKTKKRRVNS